MDLPRVLVADDRRRDLQLMLTILGGAHDVRPAQDGKAALSLLETVEPDVVISEVRLPGASGFEVLRRSRELLPRTQVVLLTAYASIPDAVAAIQGGACDYRAKPLDADELALVVARALARAQGWAPCDEHQVAPAPESLAKGFHGAVEEARHRASRQYLEALMRLYHGNVTQAALRARMTRESLHRVLRRYGVSPESHRDAGPALAHGRPAEPGSS